MRFEPRRRQDQRRRSIAYLTDDRVPAEEKGWVMLALVGHAFVFLLLTATDAIWIVVVAARVWRRREAGLARAVRTNVHKPTLAVLLATHLLYEVLRRAGIAKLDRRSSEYTVQ
jgi:hypothetical protein